MKFCYICNRELCECPDYTGMAPDRESRRPHPDPHIEMGRTLLDAEAMVVPYHRPYHLPTAVLAKMLREAAQEDIKAADPARARADRLETIQRLYDGAFYEARDLAQALREAGL